MRSITGLATSRGYAAGPVFVYRGGELPIPEYVIEPGREEEELLRLKRALVDTKRDLETLISVLRERTGRNDVRVFECHLMINFKSRRSTSSRSRTRSRK
jgi:phosphoenolpyruvate-protein kinase (PTS system EI component)